MSFRSRYLWPLVLVGLCLISLCAYAAISLFRQQATIGAVLRENVASRRAALELKECIHDILALLKDRVDSVASLNGRMRSHIADIGRFADHPDERKLAEQLDVAFAEYMSIWKTMPPPRAQGHATAVKMAASLLETMLLKTCEELVDHNGQRIEDATAHHDQVLRQLAWGMAGVSVLGGVAGLVLGYGVARALSQSIRRLKIQIQDAAGRLPGEMPSIVLTGENAHLDGLHEQIDLLSGRIQTVVERLRQRELEVLRSEQLAAVGQLAAGVAHEIRNPLTSIKMLIQSGMEDARTSSGLNNEDLRVIDQEIRRMEQSLKTFLDFTRPPRAERRPVDILMLVRNVLGLIRGRAEKQRVEVVVDASEGEIKLTADGEQIQQVLVNLTLNALDAMPLGGKLTVVVRATSAGGAEVCIRDTGAGISEEIMPRLFQPFVSGKDTGLGLGLVISRRILENHGGTIWAGNAAEGGAVFIISLPAG